MKWRYRARQWRSVRISYLSQGGFLLIMDWPEDRRPAPPNVAPRYALTSLTSSVWVVPGSWSICTHVVKAPGFESTVRPEKLMHPARGYHCACVRRVVVPEGGPIHLTNMQVTHDPYKAFTLKCDTVLLIFVGGPEGSRDDLTLSCLIIWPCIWRRR